MPTQGIVAAVIPSYNSGPFLERCVRSLLADDRLIDSVFVVDSASVDSAARDAEHFSPKVRSTYLRKDRGISHALNAGIRLALARPGVEYLLFMDDDAWIEPGAVAGLAAVLGSHAKLGAVSPTHCVYDGDQLDAKFARTIAAPHRIEALAGTDLKLIYCDDAIGAAMLIPRPVLGAVGWFDEDHFLYGNDTDLCRRMRQAGYAIAAVDGIRAHHYHRILSEDLPGSRRAVLKQRSSIILTLKDTSRPLTQCLGGVWRSLARNLGQAVRRRSGREAYAQLALGAWLAWRIGPILAARFGQRRRAARTVST